MEVLGRPGPVHRRHRLHLQAALPQVDGVRRVAPLGALPNALQQRRRRRLHECDPRAHARDAASLAAVPRLEERVDALQALRPQPLRELGDGLPRPVVRPDYGVGAALRQHQAQPRRGDLRRVPGDARRHLRQRRVARADALDGPQHRHHALLLVREQRVHGDGKSHGRRKAQVLRDAAVQGGSEVGVGVHQPRKHGLPPAVDDLRRRVARQDLRRRPHGGDAVPLHGHRRVPQDCTTGDSGDDRRVGQDRCRHGSLPAGLYPRPSLAGIPATLSPPSARRPPAGPPPAPTVRRPPRRREARRAAS